MISLDTVECDLFVRLAGQPFQVQAGKDSIELVLEEATKAGHPSPVRREPFSLRFRGQPGWRLPQGIYPFQHSETGPFEIFITQLGDGKDGSLFEAVFN